MINPFSIGSPIEFDGVESYRTKPVDFDGFAGAYEAIEWDVLTCRNLEGLGYGEV